MSEITEAVQKVELTAARRYNLTSLQLLPFVEQPSHNKYQSDTEICSPTALFNHFTADILKEGKVFTR